MGVVLAFSLSSRLSTTRDLISERAVVMVSSIRLQTHEYLAPARNQAESVAALIEARTLDPDDRISVVTALHHSLAAAPQLETTTLFSDIVGFSTVSEAMSPTELIEMLR